LRIVGDGVADRVDPGGGAAGVDDDGQHPRRRVGGVDLDPDRIGGAITGDGRAGRVVLRLQADVGGADVLAVDPGTGHGRDDGLLAVVGLVHRRGDVRRNEFDADVGGERIGYALHVTGADDGHLTRIFAYLVPIVVARGRRRGEGQGEQEANRQSGGHAWHLSRA